MSIEVTVSHLLLFEFDLVITGLLFAFGCFFGGGDMFERLVCSLVLCAVGRLVFVFLLGVGSLLCELVLGLFRMFSM